MCGELQRKYCNEHTSHTADPNVQRAYFMLRSKQWLCSAHLEAGGGGVLGLREGDQRVALALPQRRRVQLHLPHLAQRAEEDLLWTKTPTVLLHSTHAF